MDRDSFSSKVSEIAHFAMLEEVGVNSKPGLVCPDSQGSHNDMDYNTFVSSADAAKFVPQLVEYDLESLFISIPNRKLTVSERLFLEYGVTGIRGEASKGFPTILKGLTKLEYYMDLYANKTLSKNEAYLNTLLYLISFVDDIKFTSQRKK